MLEPLRRCALLTLALFALSLPARAQEAEEPPAAEAEPYGEETDGAAEPAADGAAEPAAEEDRDPLFPFSLLARPLLPRWLSLKESLATCLRMNALVMGVGLRLADPGDDLASRGDPWPGRSGGAVELRTAAAVPVVRRALPFSESRIFSTTLDCTVSLLPVRPRCISNFSLKLSLSTLSSSSSTLSLSAFSAIALSWLSLSRF